VSISPKINTAAKTRRREEYRSFSPLFFFASSFAPSRLRGRILTVGLLLALSACDRSTNTPATKPAVQPGPGIVHGIVRFLGKAPEPKVIGGECCQASTPVMDESLIVGEDGALKNVVVCIKDGPNLSLPPPKDRVLTQRNCQYVPHVVVTSHDPTLHNVHTHSELNPVQNFSQTPDSSHALHFDQPELVKFKCDVHPWMTAYVYVFDHPCFAVTGSDGKFEIANLPVGSYTLVAWQEKVGSQEIPITITADKPAEVNIEYHP
jgi:hypothetical protein